MSVDIKSTVSAMCISARAMGLPKAKWLQTEDHISKMLTCSGPEFTISYLKDLKEYHISRMVDDSTLKLKWHMVNSKGQPSGWQKNLHFAKPKTSIQIIGAMVNAIDLANVTDHQLMKWKSSVRQPEERESAFGSSLFSYKGLYDVPPAAVRDQDMKPVSGFSALDVVRRASLAMKDPYLSSGESEADYALALAIANQSLFAPIDITGTSIPTLNDSVRIPVKRRQKSKVALLQGFVASINSAPAFAGQMEIDRIALVEEKYPGLHITDRDARLSLAHLVKERGQDLTIESWSDEPSEWETPRLGMNQRMGNIAFLQQPGGKLRSIANPNRYVQHLMRPLQEIFSHVNTLKPVAVTRQKEGIEWAQKQLALGKTLVSFDLSAATDTLNAESFLEKTSMGPILRNEVDCFDFASKALWYSPDLGVDVNWHQGQPLGLAPSFSLLTMMNFEAGKRAAKSAGLPPNDSYRVVGDDFVCLSDMASAYEENIRSLGGVANPDKAMNSHRYAEFCSQVITSKGSWPLKPTIRGAYDTVLVDSEKADSERILSVVKTSKQNRKAIELLSSYSSSDLDNLPSLVSHTQRSLVERLALSAHFQALSLVAPELDDSTETIVPVEIEYASESGRGESPLGNFLEVPPEEVILPTPDFRPEIDLNVRVFDYKTNDYTLKTSHQEAIENMFGRINSVDVQVTDDKTMALAKSEHDGGEITTLVDLTSSEILVSGPTEVLFSVDHSGSETSSDFKQQVDVLLSLYSEKQKENDLSL